MQSAEKLTLEHQNKHQSNLNKIANMTEKETKLRSQIHDLEENKITLTQQLKMAQNKLKHLSGNDSSVSIMIIY